MMRSWLRMWRPKGEAKPGGHIVILTGSSIFAPLIRSETEAADRCTLRCVTQLGITTKVANENDLIERHLVLRLFLSVRESGAIKRAGDTTRSIASRQACSRKNYCPGIDRNDTTKSVRLCVSC